MALKTRVHVVAHGEHLHDLAERYGVPAADIWNLRANEALHDQGRTPDMLAPGDCVCVPVVERKWLPASVGGVNRFTATVPSVDVNVRLVDADGNGVADEPYEVTELGLTGSSQADGTVLLKNVPIRNKRVAIRFTKRNVTVYAQVGSLDPISTNSGKAQRLAHLGYLPGGTQTASDTTLALALATFADDYAPTATSDKDIEAALVSAHGS
jgi:hypothetical protein